MKSLGSQIQIKTVALGVFWGWASSARLTFDLQLAVHLSLPQVIDCLAGVHATVVRAGLPDLQGAHPLVAEHAVAWVVQNDDLVLHPDHLCLKREGKRSASLWQTSQSVPPEFTGF